MKPLFKSLPWYGMLGGFMSGPYIGSLKSLIFIFCSCISITLFDFGWVFPTILIIPMLSWALYDWYITTHGKVAKRVYYQKGNLIVTHWIFKINKKLIQHCEQNNLEYRQSYYRFWITQDEITHLMYTFPRFPWTSTVIGFTNDSSKDFFIGKLRYIFNNN